MAYTAGTAAVTSTATVIVASDDATGRRRAVTVYNNGTATVYLGGATVTTALGMPMGTATSFTADKSPSSALYGIVTAGTVEVRYLTEDV